MRARAGRWRHAAAVLVLGAALGVGAPAAAAGLDRPNVIGARAVGLGGAFAAVADDPTAIYHNPAGISLVAPTTFLLDTGILIADRTYRPPACSVTAPNLPPCHYGVTTRRAESELTAPTVVPAMAFTTRFGGAGGDGASRLAVGFASYFSHGGRITFSDRLSVNERRGWRSSTIGLVEFVPALAYQASDVLAVGAGLRVGVALFDIDVTELPNTPIDTDATASANGVTVGGNLGVLLRPYPWLTAAFVYRTAMNVTASGDINIIPPLPEPPPNRKLSVDLPFPQSFAVGVSGRPLDRLLVSAQFDWTNWSAFDHLTLEYAPDEAELYLDFDDSYAFHLGAQYQVWDELVVRGGYSFETAAVSDLAIDRQFYDAPKHTLAAGAGYHITRQIIVDGVFEYLFGHGSREVPVSPTETPYLLRNAAPGEYTGSIYQLVVTGQYRY